MNLTNKESELLTELLVNNRSLMLERICDNNEESESEPTPDEKEFLDACIEELKTTEQLLEKTEVKKTKPTERLFPYIKCPKCNVGHVEEGEDYSYDTHIACCNSSECKQEYWIGYTREYNLETMEEPS